MSAAEYQLLRASAGTGKTYQLVEVYVREILERQRRPTEVVAITFTRKAAQELRTRIRARLQQEGVAHQLLDELARAPINNFHGLALQLLLEAGPPLGLAVGTQVLGDQGDDRALFLEACEEAWFGGGMRVDGAVRQLALAVSVDVELPRALWDALCRAREDGVSLVGESLCGSYDAATVRQRYADFAFGIAERLRGAKDACSDKAKASIDRFLTSLPKGGSHREWAEQLARAGAQLDRRTNLRKVVSDEEKVALAKQMPAALVAEAMCEDLAPSLAELVDSAWQTYAELKRERRLLDFGDLVERATALLQHAASQRRVAQRVRAVLVDEAQDTNRLQRSFVRLLAGIDGPVAGQVQAASLHVVGDRKQAIYTFRGADPASFEAFAGDVENLGGGQRALSVSWRSTPALVAGINHLGEQLFGDAYESLVARPHDDAPLQQEPAVLWLELPSSPSAVQAVVSEAAAVAAWVQARVGAADAGDERPGDIAVLLSAMSNAPLFAAALGDAGVPVILGGGGGFYEQPEIVDVVHLLSWLTDPRDRMAAAVVLRSPLVGLSDSALLELFGGDDEAFWQLLRGAPPKGGLSLPEDLDGLVHLEKVLPRLLAAARCMGPVRLLHYANRLLDYENAYLGLAGGEQRLANLRRLSVLAETFEERARGGSAAFAREQRRRIEERHPEPVGPVAVGSRGAVSITTVHQSKGLEFGVVILCDLAHGGRNDFGPLRYSRGQGLVLRPSLGGQSYKSERWQKAADSAKEAAAAEERRLLYVAATRAQRQLLLVHAPTDRQRDAGFAKYLLPFRDSAQERGLLATVSVPEASTPPAEVACEAPAPEDHLWATELLGQVEAKPPAPGTRFVLSVTELETYAQCLRRGALVHQLGLEERNIAARVREQQLAQEVDPIDPLARGRLAHAVLAGIERLSSYPDMRAFVEGELCALGYAAGDTRLAEVEEDVLAFLSSSFGRELCDLNATRRRHEMPFQYVVDVAPYSAMVHGQIDLLYFDDQGPVVVDFKHAKSSGAGLPAYATQLDAYAHAVAQLCGIRGSVRTQLVFLKDHQRAPLRRVVTAAMRESFCHTLTEVVRGLAQQHSEEALWPGQPRAVCQRLDCGFVNNCHGAVASREPVQLSLAGTE